MQRKPNILFGKASGWNANVNVANLNDRNGFTLTVNNAFSFFGSSVSSAGNVNGDGLTDLIVGASFASPNGKTEVGESYVDLRSQELIQAISQVFL